MATSNAAIHRIADTSENIRATMSDPQIAISTNTDASRNIAPGTLIHRLGQSFYTNAVSTKIDASTGVATPQPVTFGAITASEVGNSNSKLTFNADVVTADSRVNGLDPVNSGDFVTKGYGDTNYQEKSPVDSVTYGLKDGSLTALNLEGAQDLQAVTDIGATTSNTMSYTIHPPFINDTQIVDKKYVDDASKTLTNVSNESYDGATGELSQKINNTPIGITGGVTFVNDTFEAHVWDSDNPITSYKYSYIDSDIIHTRYGYGAVGAGGHVDVSKDGLDFDGGSYYRSNGFNVTTGKVTSSPVASDDVANKAYVDVAPTVRSYDPSVDEATILAGDDNLVDVKSVRSNSDISTTFTDYVVGVTAGADKVVYYKATRRVEAILRFTVTTPTAQLFVVRSGYRPINTPLSSVIDASTGAVVRGCFVAPDGAGGVLGGDLAVGEYRAWFSYNV